MNYQTEYPHRPISDPNQLQQLRALQAVFGKRNAPQPVSINCVSPALLSDAIFHCHRVNLDVTISRERNGCICIYLQEDYGQDSTIETALYAHTLDSLESLLTCLKDLKAR